MFKFFKKKKKDEEVKEQEVLEETSQEKASQEEPEETENPQEVSEETEEISEEHPTKKSWFDSLKEGLSKTSHGISGALDNLLRGKAKIDDDLFEEIEEILISSDMGVETTMEVIDELRDIVAEGHIRDGMEVKKALQDLLKRKLKSKNVDTSLNLEEGTPTIILVIGVNGVGKTTTIGKMAHQLKQDGNKVILAAADTFRAAAIEQLTEWSNRAQVDLIAHSEGSDPASVVFDAIQSAKAKHADVLICDTAGRLHNKKNLMNELEKMNRIISREFPEANRECLLVLDATTGQNAIHQAREFNKVTDITGIVLTKLDGTAKGGVVFPLQVELETPVKLIGIGEGIYDLREFDPDDFVDAIFQ